MSEFPKPQRPEGKPISRPKTVLKKQSVSDKQKLNEEKRIIEMDTKNYIRFLEGNYKSLQEENKRLRECCIDKQETSKAIDQIYIFINMERNGMNEVKMKDVGEGLEELRKLLNLEEFERRGI